MLTRQSVTKWQACPFISVHVSWQLDNQPLQWKSIVSIGLYLLYNSPAGNPWWQIISAPVFDWCFDVSDLQGHAEELVEASLTESNLTLPHLTPAQSQTFCQLGYRPAVQSVSQWLWFYSSTYRPPSSILPKKCRPTVQRDSRLWRWLSACFVLTWRVHTHTHTHANTSVTQ